MSLADLGKQPAPPPTSVRCIVRRPPGDIGDTVRVVVPSFSQHRFFEVDHWDPRGSVFPAQGDEGLLTFDEDGEPWLFWDGDYDLPAGGSSPPFAQSDITGLVAALAAKQDASTAATDAELSAALASVPTLPIAQSDVTDLVSDLAAKAPLASPALTGNPTAPTQTAGNNSTRIATTAYVDALGALKASLASPTFTGTPAAPTASGGTNTTQIATTAFVQAAITALSYQPLDSDLTAIAALTTTSFGRGLLALADAAALRTAAGLGSLATLSTITSSEITDGTIVATDLNTALKPSGSATSTDESLRRLGTGSTHAAAGDDSRFPSTGEKNALAGTSGTPGSGNKYVTDGDSRNTNSRTPTAHKTSHATGGSDALSPSDIGAATASDLADHEAETTTAHGGIVADDDSRLSDARTPTPHTHPISDVDDLQDALDSTLSEDDLDQTLEDFVAGINALAKERSVFGYALPEGSTYTIAEGHYGILSGSMTIDGDLLLDGTILDVEPSGYGVDGDGDPYIEA